MGLAQQDIATWLVDQEHVWPKTLRVDFWIILPDSIHIVKEDSNQHKAYPVLPEAARSLGLLAAVKQAKQAFDREELAAGSPLHTAMKHLEGKVL